MNRLDTPPFKTRNPLNDVRRLLMVIVGVWIFAGLVTVVLAGAMLNPSTQDSLYFLLYMGGSGSVGIFLTYLAYRVGLLHRMRSLRYILVLTCALTILLFLMNVWVTARLMFISEHDFGVVSTLLVFAAGTALGIGYFISDALTDRISGVAEGAKRLGGGDLSARVPVRGNDELAALAEAFNRMATRLQTLDEEKRALEQTRRDLIAWVSHDLRTPLASMRAVVEALLDGVVDDRETTRRYLTTAHGEIQNMNRLIDDLFELAQMDAGHLDLHQESTSLNDLISDTLSSMQAMAARRGVRLAGDVGQGVDPLLVDPEKIQRVLANLLGNAIRHTPPGGEVSLRAMLAGDFVRVDVRDTGDGISAEDLPRVFERFYRGEQARGRDRDGARGAGLGLAIAHGLVQAHGGRITVESEPGKGTLFSFTLPRRLAGR